MTRRSSIVFTNPRRQAERLTTKLNTLHRRRLRGRGDEHPGEQDEQDGQDDGTSPAQEVEDIARAHHGSMSRQTRLQTEELLKAGQLRCVVATSSLELGIDMGAVDLVVQVETPFSVSSLLQRIGRAGHHVGAVSHGIIHPLQDRKSTRLNSSHVAISYAVFCLKKK